MAMLPFTYQQIVDRFWQRVHKTDGCWRWVGPIGTRGYGKTGFARCLKEAAAHRVAWLLAYGPIPAHSHVLHRCDVPLCCRPSHLFLGTPLDNVNDMITKGRKPIGEQNSTAKLTSESVREIRHLYSDGRSARGLSKQFKISRTQIRRIIVGASWRHL